MLSADVFDLLIVRHAKYTAPKHRVYSNMSGVLIIPKTFSISQSKIKKTLSLPHTKVCGLFGFSGPQTLMSLMAVKVQVNFDVFRKI